jgi:hypothetical protein
MGNSSGREPSPWRLISLPHLITVLKYVSESRNRKIFLQEIPECKNFYVAEKKVAGYYEEMHYCRFRIQYLISLRDVTHECYLGLRKYQWNLLGLLLAEVPPLIYEGLTESVTNDESSNSSPLGDLSEIDE